VKAFCYIDYNWAQYPQWSTWGDARLEQNAIVGNNFAGEMDSPEYLHASSESDFRKTLGSSDNIAPGSPGTISVAQLGYPLQLNWDAVTDPSGLSHYIVYKNGALADYTLTLPYSDKNIAAGDVITYAVSAMDRAGNESQKTSDLQVTVPSSLSKGLNGEFDNGTQNWKLSTYATGASATMNIDAGSIISGPNSCAVTISQVTGIDWNIELWQWLSIHPGHTYTITFKAKASTTDAITLAVQQASSPYTMYLGSGHTLTTNVQTFTDVVEINTTDQAKLEFFLGNTVAKVWIDFVSIVETPTETTGIVEQGGEKPGAFELLNNYPNPFNTSTNIGFRIKEKGFFSLKIFDVMGNEVASLLNENKSVGDYLIEWNASGLESGMYYCKLQNGSYIRVKKMLLLK
jgi:hypothetical protein